MQSQGGTHHLGTFAPALGVSKRSGRSLEMRKLVRGKRTPLNTFSRISLNFARLLCFVSSMANGKYFPPMMYIGNTRGGRGGPTSEMCLRGWALQTESVGQAPRYTKPQTHKNEK